MAISEADLKAEIIANLEIASTDYTRYKVYESINSAVLELLNILPVKYLSDMIKTATAANLVANTANYALAADFLRFVSARISYTAAISSTNMGRRLHEYDSEKQSLPIEDIASRDYPFISFEHDGYAEVSPVPTANQSSGLQIKYIYLPADVASGVDSDLDARFKNLVIYKATQLSAMIDNYRPDLAAKFGAMYDEELKRFIA